MKPLLLLSLWLVGFSSTINGQAVDEYVRQITLSPPSDSSLNNTIDSLWALASPLFKDTSISTSRMFNLYAQRLFSDYQRGKQSITTSKAALFHFFLLSINKNYQTIIVHFEMLEEEPNLWIAAYPIYKIAYRNIHGSNATKELWDDQLHYFLNNTKNKVIKDFITSQIDLKLGEKAPRFKAITITGDSVSSADLQGKVVLLDFWATWCPPCLKKMPFIQEIKDAHKDREDFVVIGVSRDKALENQIQYLEKHAFDWIHIYDGYRPMGEICKTFRIKELPKYYLIDREGDIAFISAGGDLSSLPAIVQELLDR